MQRNTWRVISILLPLALAIVVPLVSSGYSEWKDASTSSLLRDTMVEEYSSC